MWPKQAATNWGLIYEHLQLHIAPILPYFVVSILRKLITNRLLGFGYAPLYPKWHNRSNATNLFLMLCASTTSLFTIQRIPLDSKRVWNPSDSSGLPTFAKYGQRPENPTRRSNSICISTMKGTGRIFRSEIMNK